MHFEPSSNTLRKSCIEWCRKGSDTRFDIIMVIVIAVRKMDYFFKQIGGWVDVEIENLPVTASAHGGVERQRWAGAVLAEPGLGVLMLQLLFGNE